MTSYKQSRDRAQKRLDEHSGDCSLAVASYSCEIRSTNCYERREDLKDERAILRAWILTPKPTTAVSR